METKSCLLISRQPVLVIQNIIFKSYNIFIQNIHIKVSAETGLIFEASMNNKTISLSQELLYYRGTVGDNRAYENRSSGAYIFRPNGTEAYKLTDKAKVRLYQGDLVTELHQVFDDWVSQIIRVYNKENYIEFDWLVGPIPVE